MTTPTKMYCTNSARTLGQMRTRNNEYSARADRQGRWFGAYEMRSFGTRIEQNADCFGLFIVSNSAGPDGTTFHLCQILPSGAVETLTPCGGSSLEDVESLNAEIKTVLNSCSENTIEMILAAPVADRLHFDDAVFVKTADDQLVQFDRARIGMADGCSEDGAITYKAALVAYTDHV